MSPAARRNTSGLARSGALAGAPAAVAILVAVALSLCTVPATVHDARAFTPTFEPPPDAIDPAGIQFRVLTYNVHALPELLAGDKPQRRLPLIGDRISTDYDVALLQEQYEFPTHLENALAPTPFSLFRGNGPVREKSFGARFMHFLASIAGQMFVGRSVPLSSGLTTVVMNHQQLRAQNLVRRPFPVCDGYFGGKADCLASKGVLGVRVHGPGVEIDVYNTHLDARGNSSNRDVRQRQLSVLAEEIARHSAGRAVIVAGDFNSRLENARDSEMLRGFQATLGLVDAGARRGELWKSASDLDYILYRSGSSTLLEPASVGEDAGFRWRQGRKPLSDHPALYAHFRAVPR